MPPFSKTLEAALKAWPGDFSVGYHADRRTMVTDHERFWVDGAGLGELDNTRPSFFAGGGQPVGRFAGKVDPALVKTLAQALAKVDFEKERMGPPAGAPLTQLQIVAQGEVRRLRLDILSSDEGDPVTDALPPIAAALAQQPVAAGTLLLARKGSRISVTLAKLGKEPLLVGNPALAGKALPFLFVLQIGKPASWDKEQIEWEEFPIPVQGAPFEGAGRYLFIDPPGWKFEFDDPSSGGAEKAALRAMFSDHDRPAAMRIGGVDVLARTLSSNTVAGTP